MNKRAVRKRVDH